MAPWISEVLSLSTMQSRMNGGGDHDFDGRDAAQAVGARHQPLRDRRLEHAGELDADLTLLVRREDGDDAVDGLGRVERVQRREHEVAGFGREQRGLDRLEVAHFADQDDVRILPQRAAQRMREGLRVDVDLALVDDRVMVPVQVLDRVLDRHDVRRAGRVDVVDHRRQRRALAAAGGAGDEHEAALFRGDPLQDGRQAELVDGLDAGRDHAQDQADGAALLEHVAAEAAQAGKAVGQVHLLRAAELLALLGVKSASAIASVSTLSSRLSSEATTSVPLTRIIG